MTQRAPNPETLIEIYDRFQNQNFEEAESIARSVTEEFPNHPYAWKMLGVLLSRKGLISESIRATEQAILVDSEDAQAYFNKGTNLEKLGRFEEAKEAYRNALRIWPEYAEAHCNLGGIACSESRFEDASLHLNNAVKFGDKTAIPIRFLGQLFLSLGNHREGLNELRRANGSIRFCLDSGVRINK